MNRIFIVSLLIAYGIPFLTLMVFRRHHRSKNKRAPFTSDFFRSPGETLNQQIQELSEEITINQFSLTSLPVLLFSLLVIFGPKKMDQLSLIFSLLIIFAFEAFFAVK